MRRNLRAAVALLMCTAISITGCAPRQPHFLFEDGDMSHWIGKATQIEHPDVDTQSLAEVTSVPAPLTLSSPNFQQLWELQLEDAVHYALENGKVMRTIGGRRINFGQRPQTDEAPDSLQRVPGQVTTVYDPAITEADPNFGVEGALANFDTQIQSSLTYAKSDRPQNFNSSGSFIFNRIRQQDLATWNNSLQKRLSAGTLVGLSTQTIGDYNNSPIREVPGDTTQTVDIFARQPLLQGAGMFYNRIAGPFDPFSGTGSAQFDGVVLARIRHDISLADFEAGVRDLVNEVENAYWDLYFAYRNLEALKVGRDSALATWQRVYALYAEQSKGGEADKEAQAREQYFFFRSLVESSLSDLYRAESRLRFIMGLAATDGRLIVPVTDPTTAKVLFDWNEIHCEALMRSVELRQQKWRIKQRELELMASKNLLLPRLDATARYRWVGVGDRWWDSQGNAYTGFNSIENTNALAGLTDGNFAESEVGLSFSWDIGNRRGLATVRQQQLLLARERSVLQDQELEVSHALAEAVRILDTNHVLVQTLFNRRLAAERQVKSVEAAYNAGTATFDLLLDAQRRQADAESAYYRALSDYNRSIAQVHYRKNSLLEYNNVLLAEGPWPGKAYFDAKRHARERDAGMYLNYGFTRPDVISRGPVEQQTEELTTPQPTPVEGMPYETYEDGGEHTLPEPIPSVKQTQAVETAMELLEKSDEYNTDETAGNAPPARAIPSISARINAPRPAHRPGYRDAAVQPTSALEPVDEGTSATTESAPTWQPRQSRAAASNQSVAPGAAPAWKSRSAATRPTPGLPARTAYQR
ncbi:MAG: TolC family protein [Pirellulales bacterium]|nr:TolC family protein [Pirellulales bacterium]